MNLFIVPFLLFLALTISAHAQAPQVRGDEKKVETNYPPSNPSNAQALEKSIILPSAGGDQD